MPLRLMVPLLSLQQAGSDTLEKDIKNVKPVKYRITIPGRNLSYQSVTRQRSYKFGVRWKFCLLFFPSHAGWRKA